MWEGKRSFSGPRPPPPSVVLAPRAAKKKLAPIVKWIESLAEKELLKDKGLYLFCLDECDEFVAMTRNEYALALNSTEGQLLVEFCLIEEHTSAWVRAWVEKNQPGRAGYLMPFRAARRKT